MIKIVAESLYEFFDNDKLINEAKESKIDKYKQSIAALKVQLKDAKKPGKMSGSMAQKKVKIKELEDKISKFEEKLKSLNESEEVNEGIFSSPMKVWQKLDKNDLSKVKEFVKGLVTGINVDAKDRMKKNIDNEKVTLEILKPALEDGAKAEFKNGTIRVGKDNNGNIMAKWVSVKMASSTASPKFSGTA